MRVYMFSCEIEPDTLVTTTDNDHHVKILIISWLRGQCSQNRSSKIVILHAANDPLHHFIISKDPHLFTL